MFLSYDSLSLAAQKRALFGLWIYVIYHLKEDWSDKKLKSFLKKNINEIGFSESGGIFNIHSTNIRVTTDILSVNSEYPLGMIKVVVFEKDIVQVLHCFPGKLTRNVKIDYLEPTTFTRINRDY